MYNIGDSGGLFFSMPPNMQTDDEAAFCYAVENQMKKLVNLAMRLDVWSDLEHVKPQHYDYIAACLRSLYYRSDMPDDQKLAIIKNTMLTYRYAGSVKGIEELLGNLFSTAEFVPWYEYGGRPYHFKINVSGNPDAETKRALEQILRKVKAARSVIDAVEIKERTIQTRCYVGIGVLSTKQFHIRHVE